LIKERQREDSSKSTKEVLPDWGYWNHVLATGYLKGEGRSFRPKVGEEILEATS